MEDNTGMLRDRNLVPLSRQHQHALALCVRIDRALRESTVTLAFWHEEISHDFHHEIQFHFAAEEQVLFPSARRFAELGTLVDELIADHGELRMLFAQAKDSTMEIAALRRFADLLSSHIRKEERQLFEQMQTILSADEMNALGANLGQSWRDAVQACGLKSPG